MRNRLIRTTKMQEQAFERIEETSDKTALLKETRPLLCFVAATQRQENQINDFA